MKKTLSEARLQAAFAAMDEAAVECRRNAPPINIRKTVGELTIGTVFGNPEGERIQDQEKATKRKVKNTLKQ